MGKVKRPLGVSIIAILQIIGAILPVIIVIAIPIYLYNIKMEYLLNDPVIKLSLIYVIIMIPILILLAIGLLKGMNGARIITIILHFISIITALISFNIISIFISFIIIYYLTRPHVKDFFYGLQSGILY